MNSKNNIILFRKKKIKAWNPGSKTKFMYSMRWLQYGAREESQNEHLGVYWHYPAFGDLKRTSYEKKIN